MPKRPTTDPVHPARSSPAHFLRLAGTLLLAGILGCSSWSGWSDRGESVANATAPLPLKKAPRSIELESKFVQIQFDPSQPDQLQSMWQWVDETVLPAAVRSSLSQNGLRIGRVIHEERLQAKLETLGSKKPNDVVDEFLASASVSSHQSEGTRRDPMRIGKRYELPVRLPIEGDQVVMVHRDGELVGETLRDPQFLFSVVPARGKSVAEVRLRFRPEIQHGDMRQGWVQGDAALRIDVRREAWPLESMDFELAGGEGDLFVIAETASRRGLGKLMLGGENVDRLEQQTVILLRIANVPTPAEKL